MTIFLISLAVYIAGIVFVLLFMEGSGPEGAITELETVIIAIWPAYLAFYLVTLLWRSFGHLADLFENGPSR